MPFHTKDTLHLTIVRGNDLMVSDVGGTSDPFVEVKIIGKDSKKTTFSGKTSVVMKNINPVWNCEFDVGPMEDFGKGVKVEFIVFDFDKFTKNDIIGRATLTLKAEELKPSNEYEKNLPLLDVGTLFIKYRFESYLVNEISDSNKYSIEYPFGDNSVEMFIQKEYTLKNLNFEPTEKSAFYGVGERWVLGWFANFGEFCPELDFEEIVNNIKAESISKLMGTFLKAQNVSIISNLSQYEHFGHSRNKLITKTYRCSMEYMIENKKESAEIRIAQQSNGLWGIFMGFGPDLDMIFQNTIINI